MTATMTSQIYFKRLTLSNLRSFGEEQYLDMCDHEGRPSQWTLVLGENGVGKTTLLQCLASMRPVAAVPAKVGAATTTITAPRPTGDRLTHNSPWRASVRPILLAVSTDHAPGRDATGRVSSFT